MTEDESFDDFVLGLKVAGVLADGEDIHGKPSLCAGPTAQDAMDMLAAMGFAPRAERVAKFPNLYFPDTGTPLNPDP